ncbi:MULTISPECIES: homoserine dehydrogenase [unclassified Thermoanaerobacterium]|uniref:homoserine dehydrogenase n=1 Tax=unclassified Thermoanaerobacterium TaxID=2622527 RepID=UPI000A15CCB7|nr:MULTISPECIES: homoserine dehydrogenase [unclassified Thermoanaerobacterium]MDE4543036.1 homoserine dehydrogenase [Thermoanaerobacterium sp. R66]ORX22819.1 homoserine dehydrogenase [Thermoanaerobacterium sp. PSU-2]HHV74859.1 homoserine dehydrogenase [Thermoanaerobacterium sp.]
MEFKIGLLGFGTVGSGVYKIVASRKQHIKQKTGFYPEIKKILVKHPDKPRNVNGVDEILTTDANEILCDSEISAIIEVMGGIDPAYEYVKKAIISKKHVITANKELIAKYGDELRKMADENGVFLKFEASVAGAIPIIHQIERLKITDEINFVGGIINGTTNYILTQITEKGMKYDEALLSAQKRGYAESNPDYDIKGFDALYKLVILIKKAFDADVSANSILRYGINEIKNDDIYYAEKLGYKIKPFAWAKYEKGNVYASVEPILIEDSNILASVGDVNNAVILRGDSFKELIFIGKGAGQMPTGDSVVADLIDILLNYDIKTNHTSKRISVFNGSFTDVFYIKLKPFYKFNIKNILKFFTDNGASFNESVYDGNTFAAVFKLFDNDINRFIESLENKKMCTIESLFKVLHDDNEVDNKQVNTIQSEVI